VHAKTRHRLCRRADVRSSRRSPPPANSISSPPVSPGAVERVRPLLEAMSSRIWPMGIAPECANAAKIAGNFMIFAANRSDRRGDRADPGAWA